MVRTPVRLVLALACLLMLLPGAPVEAQTGANVVPRGTTVVGGSADGVAVDGSHAYVVGSGGLRVVAIPGYREVGSVALSGQPSDVALFGDHAFVAAGAAGLIVVSVADYMLSYEGLASP